MWEGDAPEGDGTATTGQGAVLADAARDVVDEARQLVIETDHEKFGFQHGEQEVVHDLVRGLVGGGEREAEEVSASAEEVSASAECGPPRRACAASAAVM